MKKIEQRTLYGLIDLREKAAAAVEAYAAALSELAESMERQRALKLGHYPSSHRSGSTRAMRTACTRLCRS
jgi:hypothetical protein